MTQMHDATQEATQPEFKTRFARILHLSDLHFGSSDDAHRWYSQLADDLKFELNCDLLDGVIISGDVANKSVPAEYEAAKSFLNLLCEEFSLHASQLIVVPRKPRPQLGSFSKWIQIGLSPKA